MQRINRRRLVGALSAAACGAALPAVAQQAPKIWRVGFLAQLSRSTPSNANANYDAFVRGMRDLGYAEGKHLAIEWRFADGHYDRLPGLAAELVQNKVDVIVTHGTPGSLAAKRSTSTIPIVIAATLDPVGNGLVASLARPGGNVTGLSYMTADFSGKQVELLKTMLPKLNHFAVLSHPDNAGQQANLQRVQAAARQLAIRTTVVAARSAEEIERAFSLITQKHAGAVFVLLESFFVAQRRQIAELALKHHLPTMHETRREIEAGGLMSYGADSTLMYRRAATYVDKILKGTKPSDLPVEQPTVLQLVINSKTATALGVKIPREMLLRADEVIE